MPPARKQNAENQPQGFAILFVCFLNQNSVQIKACDWTVSGRAAKAPSSSAYHLTVINI